MGENFVVDQKTKDIRHLAEVLQISEEEAEKQYFASNPKVPTPEDLNQAFDLVNSTTFATIHKDTQ